MRRLISFCLVGFALMTIMGPLQLLLPIDHVVFDIPLIVVLYLTNTRRDGAVSQGLSSSGLGGRGVDWSGGIAGIILGYFSDILGGGIKGLSSFTLALIFLMARRAARHVYLSGPFPTIMVTVVATIASSIIGLSIRWYGGIAPSMASVTVLFAQALVNAIMVLPLLRLLRFIDSWLMRNSTERGSL